ncbi:MAG: hypothetical protein ACI9IJ_000297 [Psychromonas sp.]|jgi:hypothetical protein
MSDPSKKESQSSVAYLLLVSQLLFGSRYISCLYRKYEIFLPINNT